MDNFQKAFNFVFNAEGGYVNDPDDKGGATNFGVIQSTYDDYRTRHKLPKQNIKKITITEVTAIYKEFWVWSGADKLPLKSAIAVFDMAINSGPGTARKYWLSSSNSLDVFIEKRKEFYKKIVEQDHTQQKFLQGWLNRLTKLKSLLEKIEKE